MANSKKTSKTEYKCVSCGVTLTEDNCREITTDFSLNGLSTFCVDCENSFCNKLASKEGNSMALYHCCAKFDSVFKPKILMEMEDEINTVKDIWLAYINKVAETNANRNGDKLLGFLDGETNIRNIFGKTLSENDYKKYFAFQRSKVGTDEQRQRWGLKKSDKLNYTNEDYEELDRLYNNQLDKFKGQTITPAMDDIIITVVKATKKRDEFIEKGNVRAAKNVQDMISSMLADENMRKKDEKPQEQLRIDALVTALESYGLLEQGKFLPLDEMQEALRQGFIEKKKYNYSLDVADQMILDYYNTMRTNADKEAVSELPEELEVTDSYGEFEKYETDEEKARKQFANLVTLRSDVIKPDNSDKEGKK